MSFSSRWGANSTPLNPLVGCEGPRRGEGLERGEKESKAGEKENKERDRGDVRKHPHAKCLVTHWVYTIASTSAVGSLSEYSAVASRCITVM